jgi:Ser/Thr protein kinase RdoA (MazF antagonist)
MRKGYDSMRMNSELLNQSTLASRLAEEGIQCGTLELLHSAGKRAVWSDRGQVVVRVANQGMLVKNDLYAEAQYAARIASVVPAQRLLLSPFLFNDVVVSVWEWLDGKPVSLEHAEEHGATLRTLHDRALLQPSEHVSVSDQLERARSRIPLIPDRQTARLLSEMLETGQLVLDGSSSGSLVLTHGDAHDRNVLAVDGLLHLLDFDSAGPAERHVDVASGLYAWKLNHSSEQAASAFLAGYGNHPDVPFDSLDSLVWVRRVRATCTRAADGQVVSGRIAELLSSKPYPAV